MSIYQKFNAEYDQDESDKPIAKRYYQSEIPVPSSTSKSHMYGINTGEPQQQTDTRSHDDGWRQVSRREYYEPSHNTSQSSIGGTPPSRGPPNVWQQPTIEPNVTISRSRYHQPETKIPMGYICDVCQMCPNGHVSIQSSRPHSFVKGVYRALLPFEICPWYDGVPVIN